MQTVLDKGPSAPKAPDDNTDAAAVAAHKAAVKDHGDWHKANRGPVEVKMFGVDATSAIAADPERYSYVSKTVIPRITGSQEDRFNNIEERLNFIENGGEYEEVPSSPNAPGVAGEPKQWRRKVVAVDRTQPVPTYAQPDGMPGQPYAQAGTSPADPRYQPGQPGQPYQTAPVKGPLVA